jgi:AraC-like DNA-binding protein
MTTGGILGLDCGRNGSSQEFYLLDYRTEAGPESGVQTRKKNVGSCSIVRLQSNTRLMMTRSLSQIRDDGTDVSVLWFVKRGRLSISHASGCSIARAGDFAITKSGTPFSIECETEKGAGYEALVVVMPTHTLRRYVSSDVRAGFCTAASGRPFLITENILSDILEDLSDLTEQTSQLLLNTALTVLTDTIKQNRALAPLTRALSDFRLQEALKYIDQHLADPKLSAATIARGCGISTRYLSYVMRQHGETYSAVVWGRRLQVASQWLISPEWADVPVSQIAFRVGFKSAAHFTRLFKRAYAMSPRQYRKAICESQSPAGTPGIAGEARLLQ